MQLASSFAAFPIPSRRDSRAALKTFARLRRGRFPCMNPAPMLAAENLGISYSARRLFGGLNFTVRAGERVSLAGPNGAGKSTLMKIIAGIERQDEGRIIKAKTVTVGYLPQEGVEIKGRTLMAEAETAFDDAIDLQRQFEEASEALGHCEPGTPEYDDALEVFGDLQIRAEHHDVGKMKPRIERVLAGLGFTRADLDRLTDEFSGGWQMRIALAKLLLVEPSVLLLDEPTNHLDIESVVWLEDYLNTYPGAIILISHDRRLLDNLTNRTLAFEQGGVNLYSGNYSFFARRAAPAASSSSAPPATSSARSPKRSVSSTASAPRRTRPRWCRAASSSSPRSSASSWRTRTMKSASASPSRRPAARPCMRLEGIAKSYDGARYVLKPFDFEISKGDRIAIVGVNGAGKTTFSKIVAGVEKPTAGTRAPGHNVRLAYYSQDHADALDGSKTVIRDHREERQGPVRDAAAHAARLLPLPRRRCLQIRPRPQRRRTGAARRWPTCC